jgi:hypothetical protein
VLVLFLYFNYFERWAKVKGETEMEQALRGIKVIDLSRVLAGP